MGEERIVADCMNTKIARRLGSLPSLIVVACLVFFASQLQAHDLANNGGQQHWAAKRLAYMPADQVAPAPPPGIIPPQYVVGLPNRWTAG